MPFVEVSPQREVFYMITKDHESVLMKILEMSESPGVNIDIPYLELESIFNLPTNDVQAAFASLSKNNLISSRFCVGDISIYVLPDAFGYFPTKQEAESKAKRKKWDDRIWDIFKIGLGFGLGYLTYWLKLNK